jgi:hypothetical protein
VLGELESCAATIKVKAFVTSLVIVSFSVIFAYAAVELVGRAHRWSKKASRESLLPTVGRSLHRIIVAAVTTCGARAWFSRLSAHLLGPLHVTLEAERRRHLPVTIQPVTVGGPVSTSVGKERAQPQ